MGGDAKMTSNQVRRFCILGFAAVLVAVPSLAQRAKRGTVRSMQASFDKGVQHPDTATITGPATITCVATVSDVPTAPPPICNVAAPGFSGNLEKGKAASLTGAGTITLKCLGQRWARCNARVDIPPPS
jgi:hypothetical protein